MRFSLHTAMLLSLAVLPALALAAKGKRKAANGMPEIPKPPPDEEAAMLWQAGTLAASRGDYAWAIRKFQSCLRVRPKHEECKDGLKETRRKLGWNPARRKKRKPAPKPPEDSAEAGESAGEGDDKGKAIKHWNVGNLSFQKGDYPKAEDEWKQCVALDPSNTDCAAGLQRAGMPGVHEAKTPEAPK